MFEQGVGERLVGEVAVKRRDRLAYLTDHRAVAVLARPGDDPVIDPREFLRAVVEGLLWADTIVADRIANRVVTRGRQMQHDQRAPGPR